MSVVRSLNERECQNQIRTQETIIARLKDEREKFDAAKKHAIELEEQRLQQAQILYARLSQT